MLILSIWTGAWVGRAGILAELCAFPLLTPEILGAERLKGVERALRRGLDGPAVQAGAALLWSALYYSTGVTLAVLLGRQIPLAFPLRFTLFFGGMVVSGYSDVQCQNAVWRFLPQQPSSGELEVAPAPRGRASTVVLNPLTFAQIRPSARLWVLWVLGIPMHLWGYFSYRILPLPVLGLVGLQVRLVTKENGLRGLVFATGGGLLLGGLVAQFVATFG